MVELGLPSTSVPPTSFCYNEFPGTVKLLVIVTITSMLIGTIIDARIVNLVIFYSKIFLVVFAIVFHQQPPIAHHNYIIALNELCSRLLKIVMADQIWPNFNRSNAKLQSQAPYLQDPSYKIFKFQISSFFQNGLKLAAASCTRFDPIYVDLI